MCGIICSVRRVHAGAETDADRDSALPSSLRRACAWRGPDAQGTITHRVPRTGSGATAATLHASVLSLRGKDVTPQPLRSPSGRFVLAWNGQIFRSLQAESDNINLLDPDKNDGEELLRTFERSLEEHTDSQRGVDRVLVDLMRTVEGPYAFILIDTDQNRLYFGRDPLGRRSLLLQSGPEGLLVCSVADQELIASGSAIKEVDCSSLWTIDLKSENGFEPVAVDREVQALRLCDLDSDEGRHSIHDSVRREIAAGFLSVLDESVKRRVSNIRPYTTPDNAHVAILFSGGLDCATVALLAHRHITPTSQPIDLLNVALENPRALRAAAREKRAVETYDVPDRQTGVATFEELRARAPERRWNFVQVNVPYTEYCEAKEEIRATMHPSNSVMDLSIAAALYFAARGRGTLLDSGEAYETPARVLLSGLGADELLGGYSRHRTAFEKGGHTALAHELQMDLDRLPTRNLGRDDRILSRHSREARYPYLDRRVMEHLCSLPIEAKMSFPPRSGDEKQRSCDPLASYPGDKLVLRLVAGELLDLRGAALLKKRAIQFGSRSAKMEAEARGGRVKGHQDLGD